MLKAATAVLKNDMGLSSFHTKNAASCMPFLIGMALYTPDRLIDASVSGYGSIACHKTPTCWDIWQFTCAIIVGLLQNLAG